ncbi:MAG: hypothetical protein J6P72_07515 [Firmicutes bacterium]|nr:hypothetical protein [Bacillota bacterium]
MPVISRSAFERLYFTDKHYLKMIPDIGKYFPNRKVSGKKIEGSQAVISQMQFQQKMVYYITDPALERLAQKYTDPSSYNNKTE